MDVITSRHNAKISGIRELKKRAVRDARRLAFIEGKRLVTEALYASTDKLCVGQIDGLPAIKNHVVIKMLCISESYARGAGFIEIEAVASKRDLDLLIVADRVFEGIAETRHPQGLLAVIEMFDYSADEVLFGDSGARSKLLILDRVADPGNVGVMVRTAEAAAFKGVILSPGCADIYEPKTLRATMGSVFRIPCIRRADPVEMIKRLSVRGYQILASAAVTADQNGETCGVLTDSDDSGCVPYKTDEAAAAVSAGVGKTWDCFHSHISDGDVALVIGSEAFGVSEHILGLCDEVLSIPMPGGAESLNAGVAAGILMYEILRREGRPASRRSIGALKNVFS